MTQSTERQAGAIGEEIEITPEMIEAGADVLEGDGVFEGVVVTRSLFRLLAREVFAAMLRAASVPRDG
jgi:hypothetical protein